jgi:hypothetical protein
VPWTSLRRLQGEGAMYEWSFSATAEWVVAALLLMVIAAALFV